MLKPPPRCMTKVIESPRLRQIDGTTTLLECVALAGMEGSYDIEICQHTVSAVRVAQTQDQASWLVIPPLVNFHAHANRAFSAKAQRPQSLGEAIDAARQERATATAELYEDRAMRLFDASLHHGVGKLRTHTDVDKITEMKAMSGVLAAASRFRHVLEVDIVAFASAAADPVQADIQALLTQAVQGGASLLGGVPAFYANPKTSIDALFNLAQKLDVGIDLHLDEHLNVDHSLLETAIEATNNYRLQGRVSLSHVCTLSVLKSDALQETLKRLALAEITLVVLPETNLYLQDRSTNAAPRLRGLLPLREAFAAGLTLRLGTDNVRDWFFPYGDGDMLESAYMAALAGQIDSVPNLLALACNGKAEIVIGDSADFTLIPVPTFDEALATRPAGRLLMRQGKILR